MIMDISNGLTNIAQFNKDINVMNMQLKSRRIGIEIIPCVDFKQYQSPADYIEVHDDYKEIEGRLIQELTDMSIYNHYL